MIFRARSKHLRLLKKCLPEAHFGAHLRIAVVHHSLPRQSSLMITGRQSLLDERTVAGQTAKPHVALMGIRCQVLGKRLGRGSHAPNR